MGQNGAFHGLFVDHREILLRQEIEPVEVFRVRGDEEILLGTAKIHYCLKEVSPPLLDHLPHGVEVGGIGHGSGEKAFVVLTLAFAEELLVPLGHLDEGRLVGNQDLDGFPLPIEGVADGRIPVTGVLVQVRVLQLLLRLPGAGHQGVDVTAGDRNGQQPHGGEDRVPAAHIVRDHKGLVAFPVG